MKAKHSIILNEITGTDGRLSPEVRRNLAHHARYFLFCARMLQAPHLREVEMEWMRAIEITVANMEFSIVYSRLNGCVVHCQAGKWEVLSTSGRSFEPIRDRIGYWRRLKRNRVDLDFRQDVILHALLRGFKPPLRKGRKREVRALHLPQA